MSDVMLCGVLRMPPEMWKDDPLQFMQVHSRMLEAANELERRAAEIKRLTAALQEIEALDDRTISDSGKIMRALLIARRALEPKP